MISYFAKSITLKTSLVSKGEEHGDKPMWLASLSKAITSFVALQLVDEGKITLDMPLNKVLPLLDKVQILENGALIPRKKDITLRLLLSHTSGFGYDTWSKELGVYMKANAIPAMQSYKLKALDVPLLAEPATRFIYGTSIDFVGQVIEKLTGMSLFEAMQARLFSKLDMPSLTFVLNDAQKQTKMPMNMRHDDGTMQVMNFVTQDVQEFQMGGGGLWGTPNDYLKFLTMLLKKGEGFLSKQLFKEAMTNQIGDLQVGFDEPVSLRATQPYELIKGTSKKWGLLGMINEGVTKEGRSPNSLAWCGLANCFYFVDFEKGITGLFASQVFPFADSEVITAFESFERETYTLAH